MYPHYPFLLARGWDHYFLIWLATAGRAVWVGVGVGQSSHPFWNAAPPRQLSSRHGLHPRLLVIPAQHRVQYKYYCYIRSRWWGVGCRRAPLSGPIPPQVPTRYPHRDFGIHIRRGSSDSDLLVLQEHVASFRTGATASLHMGKLKTKGHYTVSSTKPLSIADKSSNTIF